MGAVISERVTLAGGIDAQACRTVGQDDSRDSEGVESIGSASRTRNKAGGGTDDGIFAGEAGHAHTDDKVSLVFERHLGHHFFLVDHFGRGNVGCATAENKSSGGCDS